jgi:hypothetical protein
VIVLAADPFKASSQENYEGRCGNEDQFFFAGRKKDVEERAKGEQKTGAESSEIGGVAVSVEISDADLWVQRFIAAFNHSRDQSYIIALPGEIINDIDG